MENIKSILVDEKNFCPECNAILIETNGQKECPNDCTLIEYLD